MRAIKNKSCEWEMTVPKARASERKKQKSTTPCLRRPDSLICHSPILQFPLLTHAVVPKITASCAQSCVSSSPPSCLLLSLRLTPKHRFQRTYLQYHSRPHSLP